MCYADPLGGPGYAPGDTTFGRFHPNIPYDCWWRRPPPEIEEDAQGNVTWHVEPKVSAVFNIPGPLNLRQRSVRFTNQGHYTPAVPAITQESGEIVPIFRS